MPITSVQTLKKNQDLLGMPLQQDPFVVEIDNTTKHCMRLGLNQNDGSAQNDVFIMGKKRCYARELNNTYSNVAIDGVTHAVAGELDYVGPIPASSRYQIAPK